MKDLALHISIKILLYWYAFIFISTEFLSFFHLLERNYLLLGETFFWTIFLFFHHEEIIQAIRNINFRSKNILLISLLFLLTFIQGFFSAPNSTDSMVYPLPRMMYWIQEKTLFQDVIRSAHEYIPPFGQYILLHLYLIFGNDSFLFFSQWSAYVIMVIISGIIVSLLGATKQISGLTSLMVACIPIAVMQATSTKLEIVVTVLIVICTYIALRFRTEKVLDYIVLGIGLGLGILTKQTFLIYAAIPLGILFIKLKKDNRRRFLFLMLTLAIVLIIQARFVIQNLSLYENKIVTSKDFSAYVNQNFTLMGIFSNLIKNTMLHVPVPLYTKQVENAIFSLHKLLRIDVNDCSNTFCYPGFQFRVIPAIYPQEDIASNTFHLLLILTAGVVLFTKLSKKRISSPETVIYILAVLSFIFFSAALKWQPFHSRLHLPFFVIGTISSAIILSRFKVGLLFLKGILIPSVLLAFLLVSINVLRPYISYSLFLNMVKSFAPSLNEIPQSFFVKAYDQQYFNARPYWYQPYLQIFSMLGQPDGTIAFNLMDEFEYPLWVLVKKNKINVRIIPYSQISNNTLIISTTEQPFHKDGYSTRCVETQIEYGYACISKKIYN